ncbi:MAG: M61 family peptidase [Bacteroidia bacterium]
MIKYLFSYQAPHNHYIDIEFVADNVVLEEVIVKLPAWRPGRYELGNFAKNIQKWAAFDEKGNLLKYEKINKDSWRIHTIGVNQLHVKYNYFAADINAGSTYLDETQLYVNPVNCCLFIPDRIAEACEMELELPTSYKVATGAAQRVQDEKIILLADNFHTLADSPFIASNSLQHHSFFCDKINFNFWFQGECCIDWQKLSTDFKKFCSYQLATMQQAPFGEYHFIFQILPYKIYHGVEHTNSTVIALGPGCNLMKARLYEDLLGVSCHELFHAWNIKTIRPIEMYPYHYEKENYSKLGYVYEGVTTYYGDYLLYRSGVFTEEQYLTTFNERIQKHYDNFGRLNLSVSDSSFDTWLDGYVGGVPNRKTSIYDEGCLLAFITDIFIRKNSKNAYSLDDVMVFLNNEFALKKKGYSEMDYLHIVEHYANTSFEEIFNNYINGTSDYTSLLNESMDFIGYELTQSPTYKFHEHALGIKVGDINGTCRVIAVYPLSVADIGGIAINDEIIAINQIQLKPEVGVVTNFSDWCTYFADQKIILTISSNMKIKIIQLIPKVGNFYKTFKMEKQKSLSVIQQKNVAVWSGADHQTLK